MDELYLSTALMAERCNRGEFVESDGWLAWRWYTAHRARPWVRVTDDAGNRLHLGGLPPRQYVAQLMGERA